ncbi:hypothetical protein BGX23_005553 [Mortierella sp. AD031]|nr:hypothetical protein BGX23_005553 [Mortierella sp. AD031]
MVWTTFTTKQSTVCWAVIRYLYEETSKQDDTFKNAEWALRQLKPCALNPAGGAGAANVMHDAITLANTTNALPDDPSVNDIIESFRAYKGERLPWLQEAVDSSKIFKTMTSMTFMAKAVQFCAKHMLVWVQHQAMVKMAANRPQASILPRIEDKGSVKPAPQPTLQVFAKQETTLHPLLLVDPRSLLLVEGMILQKSDIPYEIFERATKVNLLGSAMSFGAAVAPLFNQCEIMDEFATLGKLFDSIQVYNEKRELEYRMEDPSCIFGSKGYIIARPLLYDLILRQAPKDRLHMGKKVLLAEQDSNGVTIKCRDGVEYKGNILVGADGAYSAIRQNMYAELKRGNKLPAADTLPLPFGTVCLVGQTQSLDISQFPDLAKLNCQFINYLGEDKPYSWIIFTTEQNTVCWGVIEYLDTEATKEDKDFQNTGWGPQAASAMFEHVRHFPIASGGNKILTIGDLIDLTPKEQISKVMLEEKVFQT